MRLTPDQQAAVDRIAGGSSRMHRQPAWPAPPADAAYHGLAGEIVRMIEPHSEADPVALLVQLLVAFGSAIGRNPHFRAEADAHFTNLYVLVVGETSKGRKGTAWGQIKRLYEHAASDWLKDCTASGLSSGEGLIYHVRDPTIKETPLLGDDREPTGECQQQIVDEGVSEKRLLVVESEFAKVLKNMHRESSTLSAVLREAWDTGDLRTLTKNSPTRATGAHIALVAHITRDELRRLLDATDAANGFANRFLLVCVRRSKALPEGGKLTQEALEQAAGRLRQVIGFAAATGELHRDREARELWANVYPDLSEERPGRLGAVTSRAEAQVLRLQDLYALLDHSKQIRLEHVQAALALWDYCARSAAYIFGNALGDPDADKILAALQDATPKGLDRTAISALFGRHRAAERIDAALRQLRDMRLAYCTYEGSRGRQSEVWRACETSERSEKRSSGALLASSPPRGLLSLTSLLSHDNGSAGTADEPPSPEPRAATLLAIAGSGRERSELTGKERLPYFTRRREALQRELEAGAPSLAELDDEQLVAAFPGSTIEALEQE